MAGKLNGAMQAKTPSGCRMDSQAGRAGRHLHALDTAPHRAARLVQRLAVLVREDAGQLLEVPLQDALQFEEVARPLDRRHLPPGRIRGVGGLDGRIDLGGAPEGDLGDQLAGGRVVDLAGAGRADLHPFPVHEVAQSLESRADRHGPPPGF
jgi:hypothetical protein